MSEERDKILKEEEKELIAQIDKLERGINVRDGQINSMRQMVIEVSAQLQEAKSRKDQSDLQLIQLNTAVKGKEGDLKQVLKDKELQFSKLQTLERECDLLKEKISDLKKNV